MDRISAAQFRKTKKKPVDREGPIHIEILNHLRASLPGAVIHHSPNETKWRSEKARRVVEKNARMGTLKGFPDLIVIWLDCVLCFEVKSEGGRLTDDQKAVGEMLQSQGARWAVVRSVADVNECLDDWFGHDRVRFKSIPLAGVVMPDGKVLK